VDGGGTLGELVQSLNAARWAEIIAGLTTAETQVWMPKYTLEYELTLNAVLEALGMGIAFDEFNADFSKIRASGGLYISKVKHKTFVDVNEEGTEAAAATSVEIWETISVPSTIVIDRPFLFAIREGFSGTILFMGRVMNPVVGGQ
jgi:serpin B